MVKKLYASQLHTCLSDLIKHSHITYVTCAAQDLHYPISIRHPHLPLITNFTSLTVRYSTQNKFLIKLNIQMQNINKAFSYDLAPTFPAPNWKACRLTITHLSIKSQINPTQTLGITCQSNLRCSKYTN